MAYDIKINKRNFDNISRIKVRKKDSEELVVYSTDGSGLTLQMQPRQPEIFYWEKLLMSKGRK